MTVTNSLHSIAEGHSGSRTAVAQQVMTFKLCDKPGRRWNTNLVITETFQAARV
jgi:hypothetical protein